MPDKKIMNEATETTTKSKTRKPRKDDYTEVETAYYMNTGNTSGRKGVKMSRINMAFTPEIYDYVRTMSRAGGITMTEFVNKTLKSSMRRNKSQYERIKQEALNVKY